ncbi:LPS export ABC transporter permease LptG [Pseudomonadota bacterium]
MKLLDRYIGKSVLLSTGVVMFVLLSLFAFATFVGELEKVGRGSYDATMAMKITLLLLPGLAYQLFPIVVLLGSIIGLGMLATHSELVVVRAAGVSIKRIVWTVMKAGLVLLAVMIVVGEFVAPKAEFTAQNMRAEAMSGQISFRTERGLWARDGRNVIHIRDLFSKEHLGNISIYEFDEQNRLNTITTAKKGDFVDEQWSLHDVSRSAVDMTGVQTTKQEASVWRSLLMPDLISVVTVKPDYLSAPGLYRYIGYLNDNGLDSTQYVLAMWKKFMLPVTTAVMIFLAVPFVFGPLRSVGVGQRIFVGTLCGIAYFLIDQTTGHMGVVWGLPPFVSVLVAPVVFFTIAIVLVRRIY